MIRSRELLGQLSTPVRWMAYRALRLGQSRTRLESNAAVRRQAAFVERHMRSIESDSDQKCDGARYRDYGIPWLLGDRFEILELTSFDHREPTLSANYRIRVERL